MKKTNPRNRPASQADVDRAKSEGQNIGMKFMITLILFILLDKHDAPHDDIKQLAKEIEFYCKQIMAGEIRYSDIKDTLNYEFDLVVMI